MRHCGDHTVCGSSSQVEKASVVLEQVKAELPSSAGLKATTEELHDLLQSWEQYQDRLDCEHRALSALELRTARLQGVSADLEQAPPTPLCQKLQAMQARYGRYGGVRCVGCKFLWKERKNFQYLNFGWQPLPEGFPTSLTLFYHPALVHLNNISGHPCKCSIRLLTQKIQLPTSPATPG